MVMPKGQQLKLSSLITFIGKSSLSYGYKCHVDLIDAMRYVIAETRITFIAD